MVKRETVENFANLIYDLNKSDRDTFLGCGGFTGSGKSVLLIKLQQAYSKRANRPWSFEENMTWSREELMTWIDGGKDGKGRKPEYSAIDADELISMFFRRNWYEDGQKAAIELFNKCRDRHLFTGGNIPNFWELDAGIQTRVRFYAFLPRSRGVAWVFEQEDNPFSKDPWNVSENLKLFRKHHNPYKCANFLCEILFDDLTPKEKKEYYAIRNSKRKDTENQNKREKIEKFGKTKRARDIAIRQIFRMSPKLTNNEMVELLEHNLSEEMVRMVRYGEG